MSTAPIKTCDYCQRTGTMPTFRDGETVCTDCMEKSADMTRGKYLALLAEVEQLKKGVELRDQQNADLHDMIADVHQERDQLKTELANLQIEVTNLRGLKPEIPPMPGEDWPRELPRYILRDNGPRRPRSVPHKDGYWTPWYLANRLYEELERERKAARTACANWGKAMEECYQLKAYQVELVRELTSCQSVLHILAHAGEVTPAYADDAKAVLKRKPEHSLAQHDAQVIAMAISDVGIPATTFQDKPEAFTDGFNHAGGLLQDYANQLLQQAKEVQS